MIIRLPVPAPPQSEQLRWLIHPADDVDLTRLEWYIDGSLIDPQTPFQRIGAGMVGVLHGIPAALVSAIPPPWVDSILGAEAGTVHGAEHVPLAAEGHHGLLRQQTYIA